MLRNLTKSSAVSLIISLLISGLIGCGRKGEVQKIDMKKREMVQKEEVLLEGKPVKIAVGSMITPKEGFFYYRRLLDYIAEKLDRPVKFIDKKTYYETNELLGVGEIDMAFVCGKPYVDGKEKFGLELLVAPQVYDQTIYYSYIIVPIDSPAKTLNDLKGKTFAFTDPMSNTGKLAPTYMLAKINETPDVFFKRTVYTYAHDKTIKFVANKIVDGGAVDSLIWEYQDDVNPEYTSQTKIIAKSKPCGIPPVIVRPDLDADLKERLKQILLNIHRDEKGKEILAGMMIDKFVRIDDRAYDFIRQMKDFIQEKEVVDKNVSQIYKPEI